MIPHDIAVGICSNLGATDAHAAAQVASSWRRAIGDAHPRLAGESLARFLRHQQAGTVSAALALLARDAGQRRQLAGLRYLCLVDMGLKADDVAAIAASCPKLEQLDLQDNGLTELPDALWTLTNLTHLNLRLNRLTALPSKLERLSMLEELNVVRNTLTSLPDVFARLSRLRRLAVSCNENLRAWPPSLGKARMLRVLYYEGTSLPLPPVVTTFEIPAAEQRPTPNRKSFVPVDNHG